MTVVLVLVTFLVFAVLDYALNREKAPVAKPAATPAPPATPSFIDGFMVAEGVRYHPGHTWLARERQHLARVGADEFAAFLAGKISRIELPKPGQWIRQGQVAWTLYRNGERTSMVSPIEGEVVEVNPDVVNDPALLRHDPYGKGWLMTVHVPDEEGTWRNLLPANMVKGWMRDAVARLYARQPAFAGAVAADGGRPVDDLLAGIPGAEWHRITAEFFLT
jgi:glycine cleavage system H protein